MSFEESFIKESRFHLEKIKNQYDDDFLLKIKFEELNVLLDSLIDYKPKSKIIESKNLFLSLLKKVSNEDISMYSMKEIYKLQNDYILKIVNLLPNKGYRIKHAWGLTYIFLVLPIEFLLYFTGISKYYYFIPIPSLLFAQSQIRKDLFAKKEGKLW